MPKLPIKKNELLILLGSLLVVTILIAITVLFSAKITTTTRTAKKKVSEYWSKESLQKTTARGMTRKTNNPGAVARRFF